MTFLIMLVSLVAAGVFLARARVTYPTDVATAAASQEAASQRRRAGTTVATPRPDPAAG